MGERRTGLPERIRHDIARHGARPLDRRGFLAAGVVSAAALAVVRADAAGAATDPAAGITVWRLNADWGYPIGPKGKTRCACNACVRRAENGYFQTKTAAIDGRIHPCCVCQPYKTTIPNVSRADLFNGESSADLRDERVAAVIADGNGPAADPIAGPIGPDGLPISRAGGRTAMNPSSVPSAAAVSGFARTGSTLKLPAIGAAMVAAGGALIAFRNRASTAASVDPNSPPNHQSGASS